MIASRHAVRTRRRGAILLVVLALLALFAVIGLSFVLYAESEATASRIYREEKNNRDRQLPDADGAAAAAVSQIVYGTLNPSSGFNGVDLARLMYGFDPSSGNDIPYNGVGLLHEQLTVPTSTGTAAGTLFIKRAEVLNYTVGRIGPATGGTPAEVFKIDAEHSTGSGAVRRTTGLSPLDDTVLAQMIFIPKNAPYTYPDRNNTLVAAVDPFSGRVMVPSGHRSSLFNLGQPPTVGASERNVNWYSGAGRFRTLRPRPIDHVPASRVAAMIVDLNAAVAPATWPLPDGAVTPANVAAVNAVVAKYSQFPYPTPNPDGTTTGDVPNLRYAQGAQRNDSFWTDPRLPTQEYKGRKVAPLVAPLLVPLNGKLDLNAVANLVGGQHRSAVGFGPHEINPAWLSALATGTPLPAGASANFNQLTQTRFGGAAATMAPPTPSGVSVKAFQPVGNGGHLPPPSYAPVPWNGVASAAPNYAPATPTQSVPDYTAAAYPAVDASAAAANNPVLWNAYLRAAFATGAANPNAFGTAAGGFPLTDLRLFAGKYSGKAIDFESQTFLANDRRTSTAPSMTAFQAEFLGNGTTFLNSLGAGPTSPGNRTRALVTTLSGGFARPGLGVNFGMNSLSPTPSLQLAATFGAVPSFAGGGLPALPTFQITGSITPQVGAANAPTELVNRAFTDSLPTTADGTLAANTFKRIAQNLRAGLSGVDLNRPLADYRTNVTLPLSNTNINTTVPAGLAVPQAVHDRQVLARDIFLRLAVATGARIAYDPAVTTTQSYYAPYVLPQPTATLGQYSITVTGYAADTTSVTQADYDALRWLAQLAANIVDYLDADDVSTVFVWNPANPLNPFDTTAGVATNSFDATVSPTPSNLSQRVVFGVEKPRLVLNEVYAEVANTKVDAERTPPPIPASAQQPQLVRFFVELLNPGNRDPEPVAGQPVHPLLQPLVINGTPYTAAPFRGSVPLHYGSPAASCYRVVISDDGVTARTDLLLRTDNVRGDLVGAPNSVMAIGTLENLTIQDAAEAATNQSNQTVEPNAGNPSGTPGSQGSRNGFAVVGPDYTPKTAGQKDVAFVPDPATDTLFKMLLRKPAVPTETTTPPTYNTQLPPGFTGPAVRNGLDYETRTAPAPAAPAVLNAGQLGALTNKKHAVLLQRLANPYLPHNPAVGETGTNNPALPPNPYLTVDFLTRVNVQDGATHVAGETGATRAPPAPGLATRTAFGRVQPYAGDEGDTASPVPTDLAAATISTSLTLTQSGTAGGAKTTLFSHNTSTGGSSLPFQWLAHLDRKLVSPAELLFVGASKPHELTHKFGLPQAAAGSAPLYHRHDLQHRRPDLTTPASATNVEGPLYAADTTFTRVASPLYRALEVLAVKPWTVGIPYGGRQAGKVNVNMLWDENPGTGRSRVFDAVMDHNLANAFSDIVNSGDTATIWTALKGSRSPGWVLNPNFPDGQDPAGVATGGWVGQTADENPTAAPGTADRPIKGFGTGVFGAAAAGAFASLPAGGGLEDTLLRPRTVTSVVPGTNDNRSLFSATTPPGSHPMQEYEPLRKALNSLTTVSDTYTLVLTVGFFEVLEETAATATEPATRVLGKEVYNDAPGDLRKQFLAVLDRTGLTAPVKAGPLAGTTSAAGFTNGTDTAPWVLELSDTGTAAAGYNTLRLTAPRPVTPSATDDTDPAYAGGAWKAISVPTYPLAANSTYRMTADISYDGQPATLVAECTTDGTGNILAGSQKGSRFFVGTGENRLLVEAHYDADMANQNTRWSFNATTGELKVCVRQITNLSPLTYGLFSPQQTPTGGEAATNANFGNPGPQPGKTYKPGQSDAVVRMFVELK